MQQLDTAQAPAAPDFGPWAVIPASGSRAEYHHRTFTRVDAYHPRFYVLSDRLSGGYEVHVEGPTPGAHALVRHVPQLSAALDVADACGRSYGWTLAAAEDAR